MGWTVYRADGYRGDGVPCTSERDAFALAQERADETGFTFLVDDGEDETSVEPSRTWSEW